ncbi:IS3 family transposase [Streptomyces sp. SID3343]|uniref:IS3 family transposase n=1 Tax=Streptomyces sp. SID3343 TaxID=2690260 RepID=UPI00136A52A6|nr:IS3 family transposase [Streptomyces sp. SID3343]MYW06420.1 IS3 family transposase [Streptomyces sp. SID3343]
MHRGESGGWGRRAGSERRLSSRPSSTGHTHARSVHRRAPGPLRRSRADLQRAHRTRLQHPPVHLLRVQEARPLDTIRSRRGTDRSDRERPRDELRRLRRPQGLGRAETPRPHRRRPLHRRPADEGRRALRRRPGSEGSHDRGGPDRHTGTGLLRRDFVASAPNRVWVADFTHVAAWAGTVYVAFVMDTFSRRVVGWSAATNKRTDLVLSAFEMGLWQRDRMQHPVLHGELIHHSDAGSQYTSFRLAAHLAREGTAGSIGTVGGALDNALMESTIGLYKTESIKPRGPWHTLATVELATAEWIDWYNHTRLHGEIGHVPPVEYEAKHYQRQPKPQVIATNPSL